ncbi:MAG: hypothetical protein ACREBB_11410 [Nitrosotalea sp.]
MVKDVYQLPRCCSKTPIKKITFKLPDDSSVHLVCAEHYGKFPFDKYILKEEGL